MRIRKHAILSSPPFRPTSLSSHSPTIDVCEFNRSPWDTIPLNKLQSEDYPFQVNEKEEYTVLRKEEPVNSKRNIVYEKEEYDEFGEKERKPCVKRRGRKKSEEVKRDPEYIQCSKTNEKEEYPSDSVGKEPVNSKRNIVYEEEEYDEFGEEERRPCAKKRGRKKSREVKRSEVVKREPGFIQCCKTNGSGWQCKQEAKQGKRLCEHHAKQQRFYQYKYNCSSWKSTEDKPSKTVMAGKKKSERANEFHYYTQFGPSYTLGRKRGAGGNETRKNNKEIVEEVIDQAKPSKTVMAGKKRRNRERVSPAAPSDQYYYYTGFGPSYSSERRTGRNEVIDQARTTSSGSEDCDGDYVDYFEDYEEENDVEEEEKDGKESNHNSQSH